MNETKEPEVVIKRKRKRNSRRRDGPAPEMVAQLVQTPSDWKLSSDDEQPDSRAKQKDAATQNEPIAKQIVTNAEHFSSDVSIVRVRRQSSASAEEYDRVDLVTAKTQKIFKKRPRRLMAPADTDDSMEDVPVHRTHRSSKTGAARAQPQHDQTQQSDPANTPYITTVSSSLLFSSSDSLPLNNDSSLATLTRTLQPGRSLGSGMAFIYMVIPPDGGWGWVILVISFLAQVIVDGIIFTVGTSFPYMAADFDVSESTVVLISAVQLGCYFLAGTISTALINTWGFRPVALLGATLACVAITCSSFSPNMIIMIFTYSVLGGIGLSMIWCSSQLIIGFYFELYRPIASGFSCSGAGAGIIVFSMLNNELLPLIGWRNTTRVHAGCLVLVFIMVIAYIEVMPVPIGIWHKIDERYATSSEEYYGTVHYFMRETPMSLSSRPSLLDVYDPTVRSRSICTRLCLCCCCTHKARERRRAAASRQKEQARGTVESLYVVRRDPVQRQDLFYTGRAEYEDVHSTEIIEGRSMELVGSTKHMASAAYGLSHIHHEEANVHKVAESQKRSVWARLSPKNWLHAKIKRAFALLFDFRLVTQFEFRFLVASAFFFPMGFNIPFIYAKARTTVPDKYAMLIGPSIGATNFLVRIICGFIAYKYKQTSTMVCGCGLVFGGIVVFWSAFYGADLVWFQLTYGGCYGVAPAVFSTLRALLYVRYLGLRNLTNAFGITALAMGLGVFIGTTLGGLMNALTNGFALAFAFAGLCIIVSGLLILVLPMSIKYRNTRLAKRLRLRLPENYKHRHHI